MSRDFVKLPLPKGEPPPPYDAPIPEIGRLNAPINQPVPPPTADSIARSRALAAAKATLIDATTEELIIAAHYIATGKIPTDSGGHNA